MKQKQPTRQAFHFRVFRRIARMRLVDRFLVLIMMILMLEAVLGLIIPFRDSSVSDRIDVVIRTTMASIFGYFVSSNFVRNEHCQVCEEEDATPQQPQNPQGIERRKKVLREKQALINQHNLQVKVVGSICVFCIVALFGIRYLAYDNNDSLAYIFLFRDFVCSGIGFLIGMPSDTPTAR